MKISLSTLNISLVVGSSLVVIGAILFLIYPVVAAWLVMIGAFVIGLSYILKSYLYKSESARVRRLERMGMLGGLHYLIAGGYMLQGSTMWILLFAVGTVFFVYSVFAMPKES